MSRYLAIFIEPTPYILGLIRELSLIDKERIDIFFLYENGTQQWDLSLEGLKARILPNTLGKALRVLYCAISSGQYAVIHLAGWSEKPIFFAMIVSWLYRIPVVIESDTQLPPSRQALWKRAAKRFLYPLLFRIPSMFLPGGKRQAAYFRHYGVKDERIMIAGMTTDVAQISRECRELGESGRSSIRNELGFGHDDLIFIFVGRLVAWKGIDILLQSFEKISLSCNYTRLLIVGDGTLRETVAVAAENNSTIRYVGRLDAAGVTRMFHASDVAVVPSLLEPWGLVVNEAMAAVLPVIATDVVGCVDDLVHEGKTGMIVKTGNANALTTAMQEMVHNREKRIRMGKEAAVLISDWTLEREAGIIFESWLKVSADAAS